VTRNELTKALEVVPGYAEILVSIPNNYAPVSGGALDFEVEGVRYFWFNTTMRHWEDCVPEVAESVLIKIYSGQ